MRFAARAGAVLAAVAVAAFAISWFRPAATEKIEGAGAIAVLQHAEIGGVPQSLLIRGRDRDAPVLLYLHGGPGFAFTPFSRVFSRELEEHFVVVHWDRRGAGRSCAARRKGEVVTMARLYEDVLDLAGMLRSRFGKPVHLVAQSGGAVLGALAASRSPDLFASYTGVSQLVHTRRNEAAAHEFTLAEARRRGDTGALAELERLAPPYESPEAFFAQREWLGRFGGEFAPGGSPGDYLWPALLAREYTVRDKIDYLPCLRRSVADQWNEFWDVDLLADATSFEIPVLLIAGAHDKATPVSLVREYFAAIRAPAKELVVFENSGHHPQIEESARFQHVIVDRLLAGGETARR